MNRRNEAIGEGTAIALGRMSTGDGTVRSVTMDGTSAVTETMTVVEVRKDVTGIESTMTAGGIGRIGKVEDDAAGSGTRV